MCGVLFIVVLLIPFRIERIMKFCSQFLFYSHPPFASSSLGETKLKSKDNRFPEMPTALSLSVRVPQLTSIPGSLLQALLLFQSVVLLDCLCIPCYAERHIVFLRISDSFLATRI
jgi:hypothetical protein